MCPQLMLWIAEIAGLDKDIIRKAMEAAINYEKVNNTKDSRMIKKQVLQDALYWKKITKVIKESNNWDDVILRVQELGNK